MKVRVGTLNVGTMTGKGRELTDVMEKRKIDILCVQETRWKGSKAKNTGGGFKLFYYDADSRRNGVGVIIMKEEFTKSVVDVTRVSDRIISVKADIGGMMINIISVYAPQVGCDMEEKNDFYSELDETMAKIPNTERIVVGADLNGHVGEGNYGDDYRQAWH